MSQGNRNVAATLVDVSDGDVGLETCGRFEPGTTVRMEGELVGGSLGLKLDGYARGAHSDEIEPGRCRIADLYSASLPLAFVREAYRPGDPVHLQGLGWPGPALRRAFGGTA